MLPPALAQKLEQAKAHLGAGRAREAKALLLGVLQRVPRDITTLKLLALALSQLGEMTQAEHYARRLLEMDPGNARLWQLLANTLWAQKRDAEGRAALDKALELGGNARLYIDLGWMLFHQADYATAARAAARAAALDPREPDAHYLVGAAHQAVGRGEQARPAFAEADRLRPHHQATLHAAAALLNYVPNVDPQETLAAHARFARVLEAQFPAADPVWPADRAAGRPLRVGLLSPDLWRHSVAYFTRPLLKHHDRTRVELFVYSNTTHRDDLHAELQGLLPQRWREFSGSAPGPIVDAARRDRLDVLVELSGLSHNHNLGVCASRVAPMQITYLGYPHSTGMTRMDARIVDSLTDPPGIADAYSTERLIRLDPCFLCYTPPADAPPVQPRPEGGPVVFGSFNTVIKLNDHTLRLWARLLRRVPRSRLVIKANWIIADAVVADLQARALAARLEADRLEILRTKLERVDHLATYHQIDIALDPIPYHGTTTTCEALHMGVPVVSHEGASHAGRVGLSLLSAVGLRDLVARDEDAYIELAAQLAADHPRRASLRGELRERLAQSALCDAPGFCRRFETALRDAWDQLAAQRGSAPA